MQFSSLRARPILSLNARSHFLSYSNKSEFGNFRYHFEKKISKNGKLSLNEFEFKKFHTSTSLKNLGNNTKQNEDSEERKPGDISNFKLSKNTLRGLEEKGIRTLFPIQYQTYDIIFSGKNLIGRARTGTGKTLGFVLPIVEQLIKNESEQRLTPGSPQVLVMAPTRELAKQTAEEFMSIAPQFSTITIYGGASYLPQENALANGVNIVVGTPGRIIDLMKRESLKLDQLKHVVLDEADAMLKFGFQEDMDQILSSIPRSTKYQFLLFSATIPTWVKDAAKKYLGKDYQNVDLVKNETLKASETVEHYVFPCQLSTLNVLLPDIIKRYSGGGRVIVFTETKAEASSLASSKGLNEFSQALHGDISQRQRELTLAGLRSHSFTCLVATDVAARGLDIPSVDLIINLTPPKDLETYIHRSGRTGRAGRKGMCLTFCSPSDNYLMRMIEQGVGIKFKRIDFPSNEQPKVSMNMIKTQLGDIDPKVYSQFTDAANQLLEQAESPTKIVSQLLAKVSGATKHTSRSVLSGSSNYVALLIKSSIPIFATNKIVEDLVKEHLNLFGEVAVGLNPTEAVVDVRPDDIPQLKAALQEMEITECATLPPLKYPYGPYIARVYIPKDNYGGGKNRPYNKARDSNSSYGSKFGNSGSSYGNKFGNSGSSYDNKFGNSGSSYDNKFGNSGSSYDNKFGNSGSSYDNKFGNSGSSYDNKVGNSGPSSPEKNSGQSFDEKFDKLFGF